MSNSYHKISYRHRSKHDLFLNHLQCAIYESSFVNDNLNAKSICDWTDDGWLFIYNLDNYILDKVVMYLEWIPEYTVIRGSLDIEKSQIKKLPRHLIVTNALHAHNSNLEVISEHIEVKGDMWIGNTRVKELPNNLTVHGNVYANGLKLRPIPLGVRVMGKILGPAIDETPVSWREHYYRIRESEELANKLEGELFNAKNVIHDIEQTNERLKSSVRASKIYVTVTTFVIAVLLSY